MCGITIFCWHSTTSDRQRHLVHQRVDLCEYRKNTSRCDACKHAYGEVDPQRHEPECPFRRHDGQVCDNISWWILEKTNDSSCPVCEENERLRNARGKGEEAAELNAKCDIYRYCQTLNGGPCPFLLVVPEDCGMENGRLGKDSM